MNSYVAHEEFFRILVGAAITRATRRATRLAAAFTGSPVDSWPPNVES